MKISLRTVVEGVAGLTLLVITGLLVFYAITAKTETQLETVGTLLVSVLSGCGGLFLLVYKRTADAEKIVLKGVIDERNNLLSAYAQSYFNEQIEPRLRKIEANALSATKFVELEYHDDFRKRERRDQALMKLSATIIDTTRAFRVLSKFKPVEDESTEPLVNALAQALAARETFLAARRELAVLHAIDPDHEDVLRNYNLLMIGIIIDLRRSPPDSGQVQARDYGRQMKEYSERLQEFDRNIGRILTVFLAPKHREAVSLEIPNRH